MTPPPLDLAGREAEVRHALGRVNDPELDEPVTDLRFVEHLHVGSEGDVSVGFRLPTYWCAANFAFLMADDMRREVAALPWVRQVSVTLGEHMYGETINRGLAHGWSFQATFGAEASGDLDDLRRTFLVKAFQRRQEAFLRYLLAHDFEPSALVALTTDALAALPLEPDGDRLRRRYMERRDVCAGSGSPCFVTAADQPLLADEMPAYLQALGRIGVNAEFNGALCRGLLAARFDEAVARSETEPTLQDFIRDASRGGATHGRAA